MRSYLAALSLTLGSLALGWTFVSLGFRLGWLFGGMIGSAIFSSYIRPRIRISLPLSFNHIRKVGQAVLGVGIGSMLHVIEILQLHWLLIDVLVMVVISLTLSFSFGWLYFIISKKVSLKTAIFATLPGGAGIMGSVAKEHGADSLIVTLLQSFRIVFVVVMASLLVSHVGSGMPHRTVGGFSVLFLSTLQSIGITVVLAAGGAWMAQRLRITTGTLLGPLLLTVLFVNTAGIFIPFGVPRILSVTAQMFLGIALGNGLGAIFNIERMKQLAIGIVIMVCTVASNALVVLYLLTVPKLSWESAVLSAAPGGAVEMIVLAQSLNLSLEIIVTAQITRQILINVMVPLWVLLANKSENFILAKRKRRSFAQEESTILDTRN
ncbi:AbrB family transcriptional regulator [Paenibacillus sp. GP183]|uniref:AbrB family transcriptional regulator n=1 Tax=Paenibacillus sp. GP183 TaxID=1882751 RepID=UPI00149603D4|nr:AbrB family transcriptional regulator [Paenibacillus sp. GP183]